MKARTDKKLSKRLREIAPSLFHDAWIENGDLSELAYAQRTRVSNVWCCGGGTDYWGESLESYTLWSLWKTNWPWHLGCDPFPEGHEREGYPNPKGFRPTTPNLLRLAAECEARSKGDQP